MKKLILCLSVAALSVSSAMAAETVKLAIGDWAPYTSEKDPNGKILEKVVTEAFKLEGINVVYSYYPWKRSIEMVKAGEADGTFPWNRNAEREKDFVIPASSIRSDEGVYFHLKSKPFDWNTLADLKKYKVGVTIGYKQEQIYKDAGIKADAVPSEEMNFKKILEGRIDVYQTSKDVGYETIKTMFPADKAALFTNHPKPVEVSDYYILFSRKTPNGQMFADKFDAGFKKLKASGAYDKIVAPLKK